MAYSTFFHVHHNNAIANKAFSLVYVLRKIAASVAQHIWHEQALNVKLLILKAH